MPRAVNSALNQRNVKTEVVVSDNFSMDETSEICHELCETNTGLRVIRQSKNIGAIGNFCEVFNQTNGEYFMWLADDDWIDPDYVAACVQCLHENPDTVLAYGVSKYYISDNVAFDGLQFNLAQNNCAARVFSYFWHVRDNGMFYGVIRRNALNGLVIPNIFGGDWLFLAELLLSGKARVVSDVAIHRSLGGMSTSSSALAKSFGARKVFQSFPYTELAVNAARIFWDGKGGLATISQPIRFGFGVMIFIIVLVRKGMPDFIGRALSYLRAQINKVLIRSADQG